MPKFIGRPDIAPLGLDLLSFEGGGSCPSQFEGPTANGRLLWSRYRGGRFQVGFDDPREVLIDTQIGPEVHGEMLMEQVCDLAGLTVQGVRPRLTEERLRQEADQRGILDWSGRRLYWETRINVAPADIAKLDEALRAEFPGAPIVVFRWEGYQTRQLVRRSQVRSQDGETLVLPGLDHLALDRFTGTNHVNLYDFNESLAFVLRISLRRQDRFFEADCAQQAGRPVEVGSPWHGHLRVTMLAHDSACVASFGRLSNVLEKLGSTQVDVLDLENGAVVAQAVEPGGWYGASLLDWCGSAEDRYLDAFIAWHDYRRWVGTRPPAMIS